MGVKEHLKRMSSLKKNLMIFTAKAHCIQLLDKLFKVEIFNDFYRYVIYFSMIAHRK